MQFVQRQLPGADGSLQAHKRVRIHRGFYRAFTANNIHQQIAQLVSGLLDQAVQRSSVRVICTGHSLGGAIASLLAMHIAQHCHVQAQQLACYTYGCPRIGSRGFAGAPSQSVTSMLVTSRSL